MSDRQFARESQALLRQRVKDGMAALKDGDLDTSQEIFTDLLEAQPDLAIAHLGLGRVFAKLNDPHRALEHFQEAQALKPDLVPAQILSAGMLGKMGETEEAMTELETAIALDPSASAAYLRLARMLKEAGKSSEALEALREGVLHNPQDVRLRMSLASALAQSGATDEAVRELTRVSDIKPDLWMPHYQLGRILMRQGEMDAAREALDKAASLAPDRAPVHQALGQVQAALDEPAQAVRSFERAIAIKPNNLRATLRAAQARSQTGRHGDALDMLMKLGPKARRSGFVQKAMGDIYLAMGRPGDASECYRAAILNSPKLQETHPELTTLAEAEVPADATSHAAALKAAIAEKLPAPGEDGGARRGAIRARLAARREAAAG